jgi:L-ascorbate metabolism protein UlaG (beta-lactamase superfamily)
MTPEQTVQAAVDLNAKLVLPVHRAKFTLALHARYEPINRFTKKADELNISYITPMI